MELTILLEDDKDGQVQVEELRRLSPGEHEQTVTAATILATKVLSVLKTLGHNEIVSKGH